MSLPPAASPFMAWPLMTLTPEKTIAGLLAPLFALRREGATSGLAIRRRCANSPTGSGASGFRLVQSCRSMKPATITRPTMPSPPWRSIRPHDRARCGAGSAGGGDRGTDGGAGLPARCAKGRSLTMHQAAQAAAARPGLRQFPEHELALERCARARFPPLLPRGVGVARRLRAPPRAHRWNTAARNAGTRGRRITPMRRRRGSIWPRFRATSRSATPVRSAACNTSSGSRGTQWREVKEHAESREVALMGDIPFGVSYYSADTWANPEPSTWSGAAAARPRPFWKSMPSPKVGPKLGIPLYHWPMHRLDHYQLGASACARCATFSTSSGFDPHPRRLPHLQLPVAPAAQ